LDDDLQRDTEPFKSNDDDCDADVEEEDTSILEGQSLDIVLQLLNMEGEAQNPTITKSPVINLPSSISLQTIRNKGRLQCGYESLIDMSVNVQPNATPVVETEMVGTAEEPHTADGVINVQMPPSQRDIVQLLLTRTSRRTRSFKEISKSDAPISVLEANGSVRSIIDWAKKAGLDRGQRRAFEIMSATFILTFFMDAPAPTESRGETLRHTFISEKK
jgi:hypothetical protein